MIVSRTSMWLMLLLSVAMATAAQTPFDDGAFWESRFGRGAVTLVSGNGGLTAGVDTLGRIVSCRWPSPGYHDQLEYRTRLTPESKKNAPPWHGLTWAVAVDGTVFWLGDAPWEPVEQVYGSAMGTDIVTRSRLPALGIEAEQRLFVHGKQDLLVARLLLRGVDAPVRVFWLANMAPCTRLIPELPVADWALDDLNDFACYAEKDGQRVYHFRPESPQAEDWERAQELVARDAGSEEWARFSDSDTGGRAVWAGYAAQEPVLSFECSNTADEDSAWAQIEAGRLEGKLGATGRCQSAIEIRPKAVEEWVLVDVFLAFASVPEQVDDTLDYAMDAGFTRLHEETRTHWHEWLKQGGHHLPGTDEDRVRLRSLLTIAQARDRRTGAVLRSPVTQPPLALVYPRHSPWSSLALDMAGYSDWAGQHLLFQLKAVRQRAERGQPRGSMPAALYADGRAAAPHLLLDLEGAAWLLTALNRHVSELDTTARRDFILPVLASVEAVLDFLSEWRHGPEGAPFDSFQITKLRDGASERTLLTVFMGLSSGIDLLDSLGRAPLPLWSDRLEELRSFLLSRRLNQEAPWDLSFGLPYWLRGVLPETDPAWQAEVRTKDGRSRPLSKVRLDTATILSNAQKAPGLPDATLASLRIVARAQKVYNREN